MSQPAHMPDAPAEPVTIFIASHLDRCHGSLRAAAIRHGLDEGDLPLVEQDVRIRLWHATQATHATNGAAVPMTAPSLPWAYLDRAVHSAVRDVRRRRCAHFGTLNARSRTLDMPSRARPAGPSETASWFTSPDDLDQQLQFRELCDVVATCVRALSPARRTVVALHLQGADRRAIARQLDWSEGRVRNLLSRGLADLRGLLLARGIGPSGFLDIAA